MKKLKFGSVDELKEKTALAPGSVSIFGAIYSRDVVLIIDKGSLGCGNCWFSS